MAMTEFLLICVAACGALLLMAFTVGLIVAIGILVNHLLERIINHG
jgi:flagellar biosynthesis protein FliQ